MKINEGKRTNVTETRSGRWRKMRRVRRRAGRRRRRRKEGKKQ